MTVTFTDVPINDVQENDVVKPYGTVRAIRETPDYRVLTFDEPIGNVPVPREGGFTAKVAVRA